MQAAVRFSSVDCCWFVLLNALKIWSVSLAPAKPPRKSVRTMKKMQAS